MDKTESAASTYHLENSSALLPDDAAYQLQREAELWQFLSQLTHHLASLEEQLAKLTATQEDIEPKWLLRVRDRLDSQGFLELAQESLKFTSTALHHVHSSLIKRWLYLKGRAPCGKRYYFQKPLR